MKKIIAILIIALLGLSAPSFAQSKAEKAGEGVKKGAKKAWKGTKKGAKKVGNETAEQATTAKAKLTDKKSEQWVGPEGQTIYMDDGNKYYWVNGRGKRIYVSESALKARQK
jgi:hypothetical protein